MHYLAVFEAVSLYRVGEVSGGGVAIAAAEVGDQDAGAADVHNVFSVKRFLRHFVPRNDRGDEGAGGVFDGGGDAEFVRHVGVHEILPNDTVFHNIMVGGGHALRIE